PTFCRARPRGVDCLSAGPANRLPARGRRFQGDGALFLVRQPITRKQLPANTRQQPTPMTRIASPHNPRLKSLRRLRRRGERDRSGMFLAEGEDLVAAARACGRPALAGFRLAGSSAGGEGFHEVEASALSAVSTLGSGSRVIAVYEQRWSEPRGPLCVYLHGVGG